MGRLLRFTALTWLACGATGCLFLVNEDPGAGGGGATAGVSSSQSGSGGAGGDVEPATTSGGGAAGGGGAGTGGGAPACSATVAQVGSPTNLEFEPREVVVSGSKIYVRSGDDRIRSYVWDALLPTPITEAGVTGNLYPGARLAPDPLGEGVYVTYDGDGFRLVGTQELDPEPALWTGTPPATRFVRAAGTNFGLLEGVAYRLEDSDTATPLTNMADVVNELVPYPGGVIWAFNSNSARRCEVSAGACDVTSDLTFEGGGEILGMPHHAVSGTLVVVTSTQVSVGAFVDDMSEATTSVPSGSALGAAHAAAWVGNTLVALVEGDAVHACCRPSLAGGVCGNGLDLTGATFVASLEDDTHAVVLSTAANIHSARIVAVTE